MTLQSSPDSSCSLMQTSFPRSAKGHGFVVSIRVVEYPRLNGPHAIQFSKSDRGLGSLLRTPPDDPSKRTYTACFDPTRKLVEQWSGIPPQVVPAAGAGTYVSPACRSRDFLTPLEGFLANPREFGANPRISAESGREQSAVFRPEPRFLRARAQKSGLIDARHPLKPPPVALDDELRSCWARDPLRPALQRA
jgi:hypothetical protein